MLRVNFEARGATKGVAGRLNRYQYAFSPNKSANVKESTICCGLEKRGKDRVGSVRNGPSIAMYPRRKLTDVLVASRNAVRDAAVHGASCE